MNEWPTFWLLCWQRCWQCRRCWWRRWATSFRCRSTSFLILLSSAWRCGGKATSSRSEFTSHLYFLLFFCSSMFLTLFSWSCCCPPYLLSSFFLVFLSFIFNLLSFSSSPLHTCNSNHPSFLHNTVGKHIVTPVYPLPPSVWLLQPSIYMLPAEQTMLPVAALQEGAEYCVRAQTVLNSQLYSSSTATQCVSITGTANTHTHTHLYTLFLYL